MTELERWRNALAYAQRRGCDAGAACDYADHITALVRTGQVTVPAPHAPLYEAWVRKNS